MGGEGSGGPRSGKPGATYSNRSDLNGGDRSYGDGVNKAAVATATPNVATSAGPGPSAGPTPPPPGSLTPLTAPTNRPGEEVTAGLGIGPGPGLDALAPGTTADMDLWELRALAKRFPTRDLLRLIAHAEREQ